MSTFADLGIVIRENGRVEQRVPCPRCDRGPRDEALGVNIDTGAFHCFRCGWSGRAGTGETQSARTVVQRDDPRRAEQVRERLRRIRDGSVALDQPAARSVRRYLEMRGLAPILLDPPKVLRAHAGLPYFDGARELGIYPAMLALLMNPAGEVVSVHATYLRGDGSSKAPVPAPKKILGVPTRGATKGGAIRLYRPQDGILGVAEGVENALSLRLIQSLPTWSAFCADNLASVQLPPLRELYIALDIDASGTGERVARTLTRRAQRQGIQVRHVIPDGEGPRDLNDELRRRVN